MTATTTQPLTRASVRHLLMDADGVMQSHPVGFLEVLADYVADPETFFAAVSRQETAFIRGGGDFLDVLAAALRSEGVAAPVDEVHTAVWRRIRVHPDSAELVTRLREAGLGVHLATNQEPNRAAYMKRTLGYDALLDSTYYSCDLGAAKPDAGFFTAVLDDLGATGPEVLFVDDQMANVLGARAAGLRAERWHLGQGIGRLRRLLAAHGVGG